MLDGLERADGPAELDPVLGVLDRHVEHLLGAADLLGSEADSHEVEHRGDGSWVELTKRIAAAAGAVAGGLILGVALNYVGGYLGSDLETLFGLAALIVVLMIRPSGLFSASTGRQV